MSELMRILMAIGEAKSREEHAALREDLFAHMLSQCGEFLAPYHDRFLSLYRVSSANPSLRCAL